MTWVKYLFVPLLTITIILIGFPASGEISKEKLLYNPSVEFVDDFFLAMSQGNQVYPETRDASLILRRLYQISQDVENDNYITAWQGIVNLPEHQDFPVITEIKREALAIQSLIPWYSDNELRDNFLRAFDEIWLKYDDINNDLGKFEEVFAGFSSSAEDDNPAVYIRDNLRFYGYNKSESQPANDIEFIWMLFKNFSFYSSKASSSGHDFRDDDPRVYGEAFIRSVSVRVSTAWNQALIGERIRTGDVDLPTTEQPTEEIIEIIEDAIPPEPVIIDYAKVNIFKVPDRAGSSWKKIEVFEEPRAIEINVAAEPIITEPETVEPVETLNPIENGGGLEPPEPISERPAPEIVEIPSADELVEPVETVILIDDDIVPEISEPETTLEEQPVESAFVSPEIIVVNVEEEKPQPEDVIEIPAVTPIVVEEIEEIEEIEESVEIPEPAETVNLLEETTETEPLEIEIPETVEPPVVETVVDPAIEILDIANNLTDQTHSVAQELGTNAINLVVLWSQDPDDVENYDDVESGLEDSFRVKKEEFLALLYINDAFRLEEDLGVTFDALNGKIIGSLMTGYENFKSEGGLAENPDVTDDELLRAIGQLTQGVESRRESLKIQSASLKAFKLRRTQFASEISKLEKLKGIEITDS